MLSQPVHHAHPFTCFSAAPAFSPAQCAVLEQLFSPDNEWQEHEEAFYRCSMSDVTTSIPAGFQAGLVARMLEITGLPLVDQVLVTAQQMHGGQAIGVHSDRPFLGYEIARLIVQLNSNWQPEHGGVLELYAAPDGEVVKRFTPEYNTALAFLLHPHSYHAVTQVTHLRRTVVFNFWHAANTPELADHLKALFANLSFSEFPAALDDIASTAEASLPEEASFRAGTAAIALKRWGYGDEVVVAGYRFSAGLLDEPALATDLPDAESRSAVLLADWVARLYRDSFDLERWTHLRDTLAHSEAFARLKTVWALCLPA